MEVGAVKQAFNNEVILLKKNLSQAKIQIIHKLTRKAKQLLEKKAPEAIKEKFKRKAELAVKEVLIIKKVKPKDLAKFIVTHKGDLNSFLNKPTVDNDKACARLLLHKVLQDKYKFIRGRYSNVPIQDLFMSRLERRKMKKEEKEKQKNKKKAKNNKVISSEGDWDVENIDEKIRHKNDINQNEDDCDNGLVEGGNESHSDKDEPQGDSDASRSDHNASQSDDDASQSYKDTSLSENNGSESKNESLKDDAKDLNDTESDESDSKSQKLSIPVRTTENKSPKERTKTVDVDIKTKVNTKKKPEKKQKDVNKNKNFNEKIQQRKFKKDFDVPTVDNKIVDPFFITSSGENYLSVVEPRGPDEVKDEHKQGNRQHRRALMFGHVPKTKFRQNNNNYRGNNRLNNQNEFKKEDNFRSKFNSREEFNDRKSFNNNFNDRKRFNTENTDEKPEKLHPSWEAKKKKSGILPYEGKKIVFD